MRRNEQVGWVIIIGLIIMFIIFAIRGIDLTNLMIRTNQWFFLKIGEPGIYLATFLISIFGSFTVILPVPYLFSIITILLILPVNALILSFFAAIGASIGELTAWLLGRGTAQVIDKETYEKRIKGLEELIKKGFAMPLIILFAATPLPDDVLLIALGMQGYSIKKSLIASFIGKLIMVLTVSLAVLIAKNTIIGQTILSFFGFVVEGGLVKSTGDNLMSTIIMFATIIITILIITIDWQKLWKRLKKKEA